MSDMKDEAARQLLFRVQSSGALDDDFEYLVHGAYKNGYSFRYGRDVPEVSMPSGRLMVGSVVAEYLRGTGAVLTRVISLVVTDSGVDWRSWKNDMHDEELAALKERYEIDDGQELALPWDIFDERGDLRRPLASVRSDLLEIADAAYWLVGGVAGALERIREGEVRVVKEKCGIYNIPWLYEGDICVDGHVRAVLEQYAWPDTLEFRELRVLP